MILTRIWGWNFTHVFWDAPLGSDNLGTAQTQVKPVDSMKVNKGPGLGTDPSDNRFNLQTFGSRPA